MKHCRGCPLKGNPQVWGEGDSRAFICFVGRNPGKVEVARGLPFKGPAGKRLDKVLAHLELDRSEVYITNLVKCWTVDDAVPPAEAVEHCWGYLKDELSVVNRIIIGIGAQCQKFLSSKGVDHFPMIHPAAAIRRGIHEATLRRDTRLLKKELEKTCQENEKAAPSGTPSRRNSKRESSS